MEGELFAALYRIVKAEARRIRRPRRVRFGNDTVLLVLIWAVLHDRPISWACQRRNWPTSWRPLCLPSAATMSRRVRRLSLWRLLEAVVVRYRHVRPRHEPLGQPLVRVGDSKPLTVGGFSKDRDAKRGYATGGYARGYKLLCVWDGGVIPRAMALAPLNLDDAKGLAMLLPQLAGSVGYLLADALHDHNELHEKTRRAGMQLLTPRQKPDKGLGRGGHDPSRLRSVQLLEAPERRFGRQLYALREQVERDLGGLCGFAGGLQPLPSWVRHPRRVTLWVIGKLLINAERVCENKGLAA